MRTMVTAAQALQRLREGNARFAAGSSDCNALSHSHRRDAAKGGQEPFAAILGCSDSRVPVEMVFDQDLGDLFVIRVAGNIAGPSQIGSVEYVAENFGCNLVVVLGHDQCGAVRATVENLHRPAGELSASLQFIVDRIRPAVKELLFDDQDPDATIAQAVRANTMRATQQLRDGSTIIERLIDERGLRVVGAQYSFDTGVVEFFDT